MNIRGRVERLGQQVRAEVSHASRPRVWGDPIPGRWDDVPTQVWDQRCICFPVQPSFSNELELDKARQLKCPLHGERFTQHEPVSWVPRWMSNRWLEDDLQPQADKSTTRHWHAQEQKAWL